MFVLMNLRLMDGVDMSEDDQDCFDSVAVDNMESGGALGGEGEGERRPESAEESVANFAHALVTQPTSSWRPSQHQLRGRLLRDGKEGSMGRKIKSAAVASKLGVHVDEAQELLLIYRQNVKSRKI